MLSIDPVLLGLARGRVTTLIVAGLFLLWGAYYFQDAKGQPDGALAVGFGIVWVVGRWDGGNGPNRASAMNTALSGG